MDFLGEKIWIVDDLRIINLVVVIVAVDIFCLSLVALTTFERSWTRHGPQSNSCIDSAGEEPASVRMEVYRENRLFVSFTA